MSLGRAGLQVRPYLWPELAKLLKSFRVKTPIGCSDAWQLKFAAEQNFNPTIWQPAGLHNTNFVSKEYVKTGDKLLLVHKPCLSDPKVIAGIEH